MIQSNVILRFAFAIFFASLVGCVDFSPKLREKHAQNLATQANWHNLRITTDKFILTAFVPNNIVATDTLTVYIEGDGLAWLTRSQVSNNPTPRNPIGLQLALRHTHGEAVYLARPCQYNELSDPICEQIYWTSGRFAPAVIESTNQAVNVLKKQRGANHLILIGYSGGGAVAALVAAKRNDVVELITIAGNLDHRIWTSFHHVPALKNSLNPVDDWQSLINIPQRHFIGGQDGVINREVISSYISHFPILNRPEVIVIPEFDHVCCWVEKWNLIIGN